MAHWLSEIMIKVYLCLIFNTSYLLWTSTRKVKVELGVSNAFQTDNKVFFLDAQLCVCLCIVYRYAMKETVQVQSSLISSLMYVSYIVVIF